MNYPVGFQLVKCLGIGKREGNERQKASFRTCIFFNIQFNQTSESLLLMFLGITVHGRKKQGKIKETEVRKMHAETYYKNNRMNSGIKSN